MDTFFWITSLVLIFLWAKAQRKNWILGGDSSFLYHSECLNVLIWERKASRYCSLEGIWWVSSFLSPSAYLQYFTVTCQQGFNYWFTISVVFSLCLLGFIFCTFGNSLLWTYSFRGSKWYVKLNWLVASQLWWKESIHTLCLKQKRCDMM